MVIMWFICVVDDLICSVRVDCYFIYIDCGVVWFVVFLIVIVVIIVVKMLCIYEVWENKKSYFSLILGIDLSI